MRRGIATSLAIKAGLLMYNLAMIVTLVVTLSLNGSWNRKNWTTPMLKKTKMNQG